VDGLRLWQVPSWLEMVRHCSHLQGGVAPEKFARAGPVSHAKIELLAAATDHARAAVITLSSHTRRPEKESLGVSCTAIARALCCRELSLGNGVDPARLTT